MYRKRASRARRGSPHSTTRVRPAFATRRQTTRREARGRVTSASARRGRGSRNARKAEERRCALSRSNARDGAWCCVCPSPPGWTRETAAPRSIARTRAGNARPQTRRGRLALVVRGGAFGAIARRASRVPGTVVAQFSRTRRSLERVSRSDALARAPGRSEPPPDETSSLCHASDRSSRALPRSPTQAAFERFWTPFGGARFSSPRRPR